MAFSEEIIIIFIPIPQPNVTVHGKECDYLEAAIFGTCYSIGWVAAGMASEENSVNIV